MEHTAEEIGAIWAVGHAARAGVELSCVRVSSARTRSKYPYYGVAHYVLEYSKHLHEPVLRADVKAPSSRRSFTLAACDAARTGLPVVTQLHGRVTPRTALRLLRGLYANQG
jgi:hypothetical protein